MKYCIYPVAIFTVFFSIALAVAQDRVVVVPLSGKKAVGDATPIDVVEGRTFSNSSTIGLTGSRSPGVLGATGQQLCYASVANTIPCDGTTGQDGELQMGETITPRFVDNGNGTVNDRLTGLIWLRNGNCPTFFKGDFDQNYRSWQDALEAANQLSSGWCGLKDGSVAGDWRLPNIRELSSLIDYQQFNPALPSGHPFVNIVPSYYWSSTSTASDAYAWHVFFNNGATTMGSRSIGSGYVLPVRGGH